MAETRWSRAVGHGLLATVGTLPPSVLACAVLACWLPCSESARVAWALLAVLPVWVGCMCGALVVRRRTRLAALVALSTVVLGAAWVGVRSAPKAKPLATLDATEPPRG